MGIYCGYRFARLIRNLLYRERAPGREGKEDEEEGDDLKLPCSKV